MAPTFFATPADFAAWLEAHHEQATELLVGFFKKETGRPSITWPESVDLALCFGWIDGIRKRIDDESYSIRFTPRRARSIWSAVNIRRVEELTNAGLMRPPGLEAFAARQENKSTIYSYEQREAELPAQYAAELQAAPAAFEFFFSQPPSYRKAAVWWVVSAAKEETRRRRLATLIELSAGAARIPQFDVRKK